MGLPEQSDLLLSGAIFYLYLARVLSQVDLGAVVILSAIAALMAVVFSLGIGPGFQHFLSYHLGRSETEAVRSLVRSAFFLALILSISAAVATFALSTVFSDLFFHTRSYANAIEILAIFAGVQTGSGTLQSVLVGLQKFVAYSVVYIFGSITIYGLAVTFLWHWHSVDSIVAGWALGATLSCVLAVTAILRIGGPRFAGDTLVGRGRPETAPGAPRVLPPAICVVGVGHRSDLCRPLGPCVCRGLG